MSSSRKLYTFDGAHKCFVGCCSIPLAMNRISGGRGGFAAGALLQVFDEPLHGHRARAFHQYHIARLDQGLAPRQQFFDVAGRPGSRRAHAGRSRPVDHLAAMRPALAR